MKATVLLGITGGIAAVKSPSLIILLKRSGYDVYPVLTNSARRMIDSDSLVRASQHPVQTGLFSDSFSPDNVLSSRSVDHIRLARKADAVLIVPATAHICARIAHGFADDLLTTLVLATKAPIILAPSMNSVMWANPAVQENIRILKTRGIHIIPPDRGRLACGSTGYGRLPSENRIVSFLGTVLKTGRRFIGKTVLVTAGGTYEPIDGVRGIANRASGNMGKAIAEAFNHQGAKVILLRSEKCAPSVSGVREYPFQSFHDLELLMKRFVPRSHILFHTAAVSDFTVHPRKGKIESGQSLELTLHPTPKLLDQVKTWNPDIYLVGFKAVWEKTQKEMIRIGREKLEESGADAIAVNDVGKPGIGFGEEKNEMVVITKDGKEYMIRKSEKRDVAKKLIDVLFRYV